MLFTLGEEEGQLEVFPAASIIRVTTPDLSIAVRGVKRTTVLNQGVIFPYAGGEFEGHVMVTDVPEVSVFLAPTTIEGHATGNDPSAQTPQRFPTTRVTRER